MKRLLTCLLAALAPVMLVRAQSPDLDACYAASEKAASKNDWTEACRRAEEYMRLCESPQTTFRYSKMLAYLARQAAQGGDYATAIRLGQQVVDLRRAAADCEERHVATALNEEAIYLSQTGDHDRAIELCDEAVSIFRRTVRSKDPQYAVIVTNMAAFLYSRDNPGDRRRAVEMGEDALRHIKGGTRDYANALNNLVVYYVATDNFTKADATSRKALKESKKIYGTQTGEYASMLANQAARLASVRAYPQAIQYAAEAKRIYTEAGQGGTLLYARFLMTYASICSCMEQHAESIALYEEALPLLRSVVGEAHTDYMSCLSNLAAVHNQSGNAEKAEAYNQLLSARLGTGSASHTKHARVLNKQAAVLASAGNYEQAVKTETAALAIFRQAGETEGMVAALNKLSELYACTRRYRAAIDTALCAIRLLEGHDNLRLLKAEAMNHIATAYHYQSRHDSALIYCREAIRIQEDAADTASSFYAKTLSNLALYHFMCDSVETAIAFCEKAKRIQLNALGEDHPDNVPMFYNLAHYYNRLADSRHTQSYCHRALQLQSRIVRDNFSYRTSIERETFWNMKSYVFKAIPTFTYLHQQNDSLLADSYNALLFSKGILLNSEINFHNFLLQVGDSVLLEKYDRLTLLRREIDACYQLPPAEREGRLTTAQQEATALEKQLVRECKEYGNFMAALDGDFRKVAAALGPDEMAVELMSLDIQGKGTTYAALYLRKGWEVPRMKILFNQWELMQLDFGGMNFKEAGRSREGINRIYRDSKFGQLVWGKLLPEMEGIGTLYFAPAGMFYQLGAEYLALDDEHTSLSDRYRCHRLSSTRLIAEKKKRQPLRSATVFGGLAYDMGLASIEEAHTRFRDYVFEAPDGLYAERGLTSDTCAFDSLTSRGTVAYLPGTLAEAEYIGEQLMQAEIPTNLFVGTEGTEEAFKALSGKRQNLIHIATHGFYFTDEQSQGSQLQFLLHEDAGGTPLSHSGLLFSGANYVLSGKRLPAGFEDGVLTAREISLLNLSEADLVVLSACQTGVGEVRDDGVFGLQRGFKKAGASTLLMSLWSVNDTATMAMMNAFYAALVKGQSKHDAFRTALAEIRANGFSDPYYWASFIMLDDL